MMSLLVCLHKSVAHAQYMSLFVCPTRTVFSALLLSTAAASPECAEGLFSIDLVYIRLDTLNVD